MTLDEIFEKYPDEKEGFYRKCKIDLLRIHRPDLTEKQLAGSTLKYGVKWLKYLKVWGNEKLRELGFIIPSFMIEDANADDWELHEENT